MKLRGFETWKTKIALVISSVSSGDAGAFSKIKQRYELNQCSCVAREFARKFVNKIRQPFDG